MRRPYHRPGTLVPPVPKDSRSAGASGQRRGLDGRRGGLVDARSQFIGQVLHVRLDEDAPGVHRKVDQFHATAGNTAPPVQGIAQVGVVLLGPE